MTAAADKLRLRFRSIGSLLVLDDPPLIQITWNDATGIRAPQGEDLHRLVEFTYAVARAALGLPRFATLPPGRTGEIALSDALRSMPLDVIDDLWDEHRVRASPTAPELIHRYVFHVGLLIRPDRTDTLPLAAPPPETLEWLWSRGVGGRLPGTGQQLARFINAALIRARHTFLAEDKRLEDWELLDALDGDLVPVDDLWEQAGLAETPATDQTMFRWAVGTYLSTRVEGGGLTLGPPASD